MKVLQINAVFGVYSTGRNTLELANELNNQGHECYVAYSQGTTRYKNGYRIGTFIEKKIHALFSRVFGKQGYYSAFGTKKLLRYIDKISPDIVYLGNLHANYVNLNILLRYLAKKDIATVVILHDCWFYTGKCMHYTVENCYKWQTECNNCPRIKKDNKSYFFDCTKKMFNDKKELFGNIRKLAVIGVSDWVTNEAKKSFLSKAKIVKRIYNWIDLEVFKPQETTDIKKKLGLTEKFVIVGVASRWSIDKGLADFINLSKIAPTNYRIVLVGYIDKNVNLPNNILSVGSINNINELAKYYSMADAFVHLSLEETFGKVTAEAIACGTPVIVYNSTASPELVGKDCGYVVKKNDIFSVLDKLLEIEKNTKVKYTFKCVEHAKEAFNLQKNTKQYLELYAQLISDEI